MGSAGERLAALQAAPRLHSGGVGYGSWRDSMDVFLQRTGAEGIHRKGMTEAAWLAMASGVDGWVDEALAAACSVALGGSGSGSGTKGAAAGAPKAQQPLGVEEKEARKLVTATVERSRRVHGTLYSSLPEELRAQTAHIPSGWAHGLWHVYSNNGYGGVVMVLIVDVHGARRKLTLTRLASEGLGRA